MTETWLDALAVRDPAPLEKQGYASFPSRLLTEIVGEVKHSMAGSWAAARSRLFNLEEEASWTFSVLKDGRIYQHYPLESVTWHAGYIANRHHIGIEHEGGSGGPSGNTSEPLTERQYAATLALTRELRRLLPHLGPPSRETNLREHNEFMATACPSGRIPWARLIADLLTGEDNMGMTPEELARLARLECRVEFAFAQFQHVVRNLSPVGLAAAKGLYGIAAAWQDYNVGRIPPQPADWSGLET